MYGDFSRFDDQTNPEYDGVWFQQGRVQLDADFNEQSAIIRNWLRSLTRDMIGPFGGQGDTAGFAVTLDADGDLIFSAGYYYVQGARCLLRPAANGEALNIERISDGTYRSRSLPKAPYLVHLRVWDETVSALIDPALLEPALGANAPDTTLRSRTAWRLHIATDIDWIDHPPTIEGEPQPAREYVNDAYDGWSRPTDRPRLRARVPEAARREASLVSPTAGYRGVENQLYRVEIHKPTGHKPGGETFKWSRDNGSVAFSVSAVASGEKPDGQTTVLTLTGLGRDGRSTLAPGDWVELIDRSWAPFGEPGPLLSVQRVDPTTSEVTVAGDMTLDISPERMPPLVLRRWDQSHDSGDADGIPLTQESGEDPTAEGWFELEDGIQIQFPSVGGNYQRGDFWLIPARTATGSVLWPSAADGPAALEPQGPQRTYAPLALITDAGVTDLRTLFVPLSIPDPDPLPAIAPKVTDPPPPPAPVGGAAAKAPVVPAPNPATPDGGHG